MEFDLPKTVNELTEAIWTIFQFSNPIYDIHVESRGSTWSIAEQTNKMHEEVNEVWNAFRKQEGKERLQHELIDVIMTDATLFSMLRDTDTNKGLTKEILHQEVSKVVTKLWKREGILT